MNTTSIIIGPNHCYLVYPKYLRKETYTQLFQHLTVNSLLHANQYGFRAKHSTELAIIELVDRIYSQLDEKIPIDICMDLSKAFGTIDHEILISKMEHYRIIKSRVTMA